MHATGVPFHQRPLQIKTNLGIDETREENVTTHSGVAVIGSAGFPKDFRQKTFGYLDFIGFFRALTHLHGQDIPEVRIRWAVDFLENGQVILPCDFDYMLSKLFDSLEG
jgi:hypothetical protein